MVAAGDLDIEDRNGRKILLLPFCVFTPLYHVKVSMNQRISKMKLKRAGRLELKRGGRGEKTGAGVGGAFPERQRD